MGGKKESVVLRCRILEDKEECEYELRGQSHLTIGRPGIGKALHHSQ
jgi:hypothetical protein